MKKNNIIRWISFSKKRIFPKKNVFQKKKKLFFRKKNFFLKLFFLWNFFYFFVIFGLQLLGPRGRITRIQPELLPHGFDIRQHVPCGLFEHSPGVVTDQWRVGFPPSSPHDGQVINQSINQSINRWNLSKGTKINQSIDRSNVSKVNKNQPINGINRSSRTYQIRAINQSINRLNISRMKKKSSSKLSRPKAKSWDISPFLRRLNNFTVINGFLLILVHDFGPG